MIDEVKKIYLKSGLLEKSLVIFMILGVLVVSVGLFRGILQTSQVQIEYISEDNVASSEAKLVVDIEGAVNMPGVYELSLNSRVKDVLVKAGGYQEKADRVYCEKTINLAAPLKDGQKIYIPFVSDTPKVLGYSVPEISTNLININTATEAELDTLWGIGASRIENIVKNRPYETLEELVSKKVFTKQILEKNRERISVY